jgi:hypothetical protein
MYCDADGALLTWDTYSPRYTAITNKHPWMLSEDERRQVELSVQKCPRGGTFLFRNPPLCPHCHSDFRPAADAAEPRQGGYFFVCGERFDADGDNLWESQSTNHTARSE